MINSNAFNRVASGAVAPKSVGAISAHFNNRWVFDGGIGAARAAAMNAGGLSAPRRK